MKDKIREYREREMREGFDQYGIPEYMRGGLERYILDGIPPGDFLTAVLSNDLEGSVSRADDVNALILPNYCRFLYNHVPSQCKGSPERVKEWIAKHKKEREEEEYAL